MNQKHLASEDEYKKYALPEEKLKFFVKSPFQSINLPLNSFFTFHVPNNFVMGAQVGTAYVVRLVNDGPILFDVDIYQNFHDVTGANIERRGPVKTITFHHGSELPNFMHDQLSQDQTQEAVAVRGMITKHIENGGTHQE
jgi:hypothetical protein